MGDDARKTLPKPRAPAVAQNSPSLTSPLTRSPQSASVPPNFQSTQRTWSVMSPQSSVMTEFRSPPRRNPPPRPDLEPKRQAILRELEITETTYIKNLHTLTTDFTSRMLLKMAKYNIAEPELHKWLVDIGMLYAFHKGLFQAEIQQKRTVAAFVQYSKVFQKYAGFLQFYQQADKLIKQKLGKYTVRKGGVPEEFSQLLLAVIIRKSQYDFMLADLSKYTTASHPEREILDRALQVIKGITTSDNNGMEEEQVDDKIFAYVPRAVLDRFTRIHNAASKTGQTPHYLPTSAECQERKYAALVVADVSGFTRLNEIYSGDEKGGAEAVTFHLNKYFTRLLNIIEQHGGDCVKFAGDALIIIFSHDNEGDDDDEDSQTREREEPATNSISFTGHDRARSVSSRRGSLPRIAPIEDVGKAATVPSGFSGLMDKLSRKGKKKKEDKAEMAMRAIQCALHLNGEGGQYSAGNGIELSLHVAVSTGKIYLMHLGGENGEWEFLVAGEPFAHIGKGVELSKTGEVVVSKKTWELVSEWCEGVPIPKCKTGEVKISKVLKPLEVEAKESLDLPFLSSNAKLAVAVRAYVPRCVLDKLDAGQGTQWLAERRLVTVIFTNIKGLALDKKSPKVQTAQCALRNMMKIVEVNEGYRRQFLVDDKGTTLIVVFGVPPFAHEDDAYRALKTALELRTQLVNLGMEHSIGIATGNVYVGAVGSPTRQEHAVVGDIVNMSARLACKPSDEGILCDQDTYDKSLGKVKVKDMGEISVKGRQASVHIWAPLECERLTNPKPSEGETVNRADETETFVTALIDLQEQKIPGRTIFLEGEPGIGKSQLLRNFYRITSLQSANIYTYYAEVDATQKTQPFAVWSKLLEQVMDLPPPSPGNTKKRRRKCKDFLKYISPGSVYMTKDQRFPILNKVLLQSLEIPENELTRMISGMSSNEPMLLENQTFAFLLEIISNTVARLEREGRFTVWFIEDVHLLDPNSCKLLIKVAEIVRPMLLVISARAPSLVDKEQDLELSNEWPSAYAKLLQTPDVVSMKLLGLDETTCERLACQRLKVRGLDDEVKKLIFGRTGCNPLYVVEVASHLAQKGYIVVNSEGICVFSPEKPLDEASLKLPSSIKGLVNKRVDDLPPNESLLCKLASVFGPHEIRTDFLAELLVRSGGKKETMGASLDMLQKLAILRQSEDGAFNFCHELVQRACYDMLLFKHKHDLHKLLVELMTKELAATTEEDDGGEGSGNNSGANSSTHAHQTNASFSSTTSGGGSGSWGGAQSGLSSAPGSSPSRPPPLLHASSTSSTAAPPHGVQMPGMYGTYSPQPYMPSSLRHSHIGTDVKTYRSGLPPSAPPRRLESVAPAPKNTPSSTSASILAYHKAMMAQSLRYEENEQPRGSSSVNSTASVPNASPSLSGLAPPAASGSLSAPISNANASVFSPLSGSSVFSTIKRGVHPPPVVTGELFVTATEDQWKSACEKVGLDTIAAAKLASLLRPPAISTGTPLPTPPPPNEPPSPPPPSLAGGLGSPPPMEGVPLPKPPPREIKHTRTGTQTLLSPMSESGAGAGNGTGTSTGAGGTGAAPQSPSLNSIPNSPSMGPPVAGGRVLQHRRSLDNKSPSAPPNPFPNLPGSVGGGAAIGTVGGTMKPPPRTSEIAGGSSAPPVFRRIMPGAIAVAAPGPSTNLPSGGVASTGLASPSVGGVSALKSPDRPRLSGLIGVGHPVAPGTPSTNPSSAHSRSNSNSHDSAPSSPTGLTGKKKEVDFKRPLQGTGGAAPPSGPSTPAASTASIAQKLATPPSAVMAQKLPVKPFK